MTRKPQEISVYEMMQIRYNIEHVFMRDKFFLNPREFMSIIVSYKGAYGIYDYIYKQHKIDNPYNQDDFDVSGYKFGLDNKLVCIDLPEPKHQQLCHRIYIVMDPDYKKNNFYTIEKGQDGSFLCQWVKKSHLNLKRVDLCDENIKEAEMEFIVARYTNCE